MNRNDISHVLTVASFVDQRAPQADPDVLRVWHAMLEDVPVHVAERAVREHYRRSRETITPADIVEAWRAEKQRQLPLAEVLPQPIAAPEVGARGMLRVVGELAAAKALRAGGSQVEAEEARGVAEGELEARRRWSTVRCPHCRAAAGSRCTRPGGLGGPVERTSPHPSRVEAAMEVVVTESRSISQPPL